MRPKKGDQIRRVAMVFAGGPAPAANAVISAAAISFLEDGREAVGFFHGYSSLQDYHPVSKRLLPGEHYRVFKDVDVRGIRNSRGIIIGTARANPGKPIDGPGDLADAKKNHKLRNVYNAMVDLEIDALISIGGDDTHEFLVLAETGESEVFYDSQITDLKFGDREVDYDSVEQCQAVLEEFTSRYARTDETHDEAKFADVPEERRRVASSTFIIS